MRKKYILSKFNGKLKKYRRRELRLRWIDDLLRRPPLSVAQSEGEAKAFAPLPAAFPEMDAQFATIAIPSDELSDDDEDIPADSDCPSDSSIVYPSDLKIRVENEGAEVPRAGFIVFDAGGQLGLRPLNPNTVQSLHDDKSIPCLRFEKQRFTSGKTFMSR